jgi:AbiV family abortive infection protein
MTEEETIAWLLQPRAPILRHGALSRDKVAEAVTAYLANGLDLFEEALLLCAHKKVPMAAALAVLGLEEIAKIPQIVNTFLRFEHGVEKDAWTTYWKTGGSHKAKQALILAYGQKIRKAFDRDPFFGRRLYRYYAPEKILETLDAFKQSNFYVDLRQDGVHSPAGDDRNRAALDYLLTFGQERADSFCAWHVSARRSADYLERGLGRRPDEWWTWTAHYAMLEVRADILYEVVALSASYVPDYMTFYSFAEQYREKVSDEYFRAALRSLATLLRDRVERFASLPPSLPLYFARYMNAVKLMSGLTHQEEIVGTSFGKELQEILWSWTSKGPV